MEPVVSRLGGPEVVVDDFDGDLSIELDTSRLQASEIFWYGAYNRALVPLVKRLLRPGDCVVDAGANIGEIALVAARAVTASGRVLAFEPHRLLADVLAANAARNGFSHLEVVCEALSDAPGTLTLYESSIPFRHRLHEGLGTLYPTATRSERVAEVPLARLDDVLEGRQIDRIDLLKVDVEGAELPVLRGATECLRRDQPWVVVEVQDETAQAAGYRADDVLRFLEDFGYRFWRLHRKSLLPLTRATLLPFQNVLAVPPGRARP